jgi:hypothetical protein
MTRTSLPIINHKFENWHWDGHAFWLPQGGGWGGGGDG